jgi:hypothetical protein
LSETMFRLSAGGEEVVAHLDQPSTRHGVPEMAKLLR